MHMQLLVAIDDILEQAIAQRAQRYVEHLLEIRRHLGANRVDQARLGHVGQKGQIREVFVVIELSGKMRLSKALRDSPLHSPLHH